MSANIQKICLGVGKGYFWLIGMTVLLSGWNFFSYSRPYLDVVLIAAAGLFVYFYPPVKRIEKCFYTLFLIFWMCVWFLGAGIILFYRAERNFSVEDITLIIEADWHEVAEFFQEPSVFAAIVVMTAVAGILYPAVQRGMPYGIPLSKY